MEKEVIVKWKIKETETERILNLLPTLVEQTRNEKGNLSYNIYQSAEDPNVLFLHERYVNADAAEEHKAASHYQETVALQIIPHLEVREVSVLKKLY
ncbi:putative quinol monooxygenase [Desertivirga xinjiangensis]|uniref:putative quinol monooxygenase n=1 Tax=Desertivirga xinjiangensis TaxID=539206 RepID=UPI002109A2D2|nr:putative quinol monooxygenase [Pedobacter xinjiangensis]